MTTRQFRTYHQVDASAGAELVDQVVEQRRRLETRLTRIDRVVAIASGKGGVGKSAITANLAAVLASRGRSVGVADADLNGPSLARMLGASGARLEVGDDGIQPAIGAANVRLMSMDLLLTAEDSPVRWREPTQDSFIWQSTLETGALREFLADVAWGEADYLLIDVPPGTDKLARLLQLVPRPAAVILVTTPSEMARVVVSKSVRLVQEAGVQVTGLVANMTHHVCSACGVSAPLFEADGARRLAESVDAALWAEIPFDPRLAASTDGGTPFVLDEAASPAAVALAALADRLEHETTPERSAP